MVRGAAIVSAAETPLALVTGASRGIGAATARRLVADGHRVVLAARSAGPLAELVTELAAGGGDALAVTTDLTDTGAIDALLDATREFAGERGRLDVLVNNAGVATGGYTAPSEASLADMQAVYDVNVFGPVRVTQAFVPFLRKAGQGRIVMMSSSLGSIGEQLDMTSGTYGVNLLGYNSSKSALNMITVSFAKELLAHGIKVNAANPGYVATDLNNHQGYRSVEQGAAIAVHLATLGPMGPTAGFFSDGTEAKLGRHTW